MGQLFETAKTNEMKWYEKIVLWLIVKLGLEDYVIDEDPDYRDDYGE